MRTAELKAVRRPADVSLLCRPRRLQLQSIRALLSSHCGAQVEEVREEGGTNLSADGMLDAMSSKHESGRVAGHGIVPAIAFASMPYCASCEIDLLNANLKQTPCDILLRAEVAGLYPAGSGATWSVLSFCIVVSMASEMQNAATHRGRAA